MKWHLKGEPKAVQVKALELLEQRVDNEGLEGYGLWMEQGLAKTTTTLNRFLELYLSDRMDTLFIVAKRPLRHNWVDEAKKWGYNIPFTVYETGGWVGPMPAPGKPRTLVGYYQNIHLDRSYNDYMAAITSSGKVLLVGDESQVIKGPYSKYTKKFFDINTMANSRMLLSGTPQTQSPLDWWSQLRILRAIRGVSAKHFELKYCEKGGFMGKQTLGVNKYNLHELQEIISNHGFIAHKKDWAADLPDKDWNTIRLDMTSEQIKHYRTMELEFYAELDRDNIITANMVISSLMKLQQISSGFIISENGQYLPIIDPIKIPKIIAIKELIEQSETKLLVFTHFKYSTKLLANVLKEYDPCILEGGMEGDKVQQEVRKFNNSKSKIMVAQVSVGSSGHTLLGNEDMPCYTTIFYENSFSLESRSQAEDRNHRFGQIWPVTYYDFVSSKIEERVINALQKKKQLVKDVVDFIKTKPEINHD